MNGGRSVFTLAPHPAPWWDLAHVTAANLGWWITALLVTGIVLVRVRGLRKRSHHRRIGAR